MSTLVPVGVTAGRYEKQPAIALPADHAAWQGKAAWSHLRTVIGNRTRAVVAIDAYPGSDIAGLQRVITAEFPDAVLIDIEESAALSTDEIDAIVAPNLTDDRVFGVMGHHTLDEFYDPAQLQSTADAIENEIGIVFVVGWGATLVPVSFDLVVLADLARWEIQLRQRRGAPNWRANNPDEDPLRKIKRGFFVEWRVADRHKRAIFDSLDFVLDTNGSTDDAKLITAETFRTGMDLAASQPFRVVPYFDPGVWGGQWMKEVFDLPERENYAWSFDGVPEENSILLAVGGLTVELPALDVVLLHPRELLGEKTFARFGAEFPIRFDLLDTMDGGNLSLQVHPLTDYIQTNFGMHYTQDESYYLLDAADDAVVYLGVHDNVDRDAMVGALRSAAAGETPLDAAAFVNKFPARKHDHFSIPAGTVHCSGANSMVLEISATPYIFTFKMWDWGRVGLDGVPRPIHLDHAIENIQWNRDRSWVNENLIDAVEELESGDGWTEERTGLHSLEFIEVRRHWFTSVVHHDTSGTLNVLNLVEGAEAIVESPTARSSLSWCTTPRPLSCRRRLGHTRSVHTARARTSAARR
jgi:mannose-6-phosphate isomerase class I